MKTQFDKVKDIVDREGEISRNFCLREYITTRLSAYILDLKHIGYEFTTKKEKGDYLYYCTNRPKIKKVVPVTNESGMITSVKEILV